MEPIVLFRHSLAEEGEFETCSKHFNCTTTRMACRDNLVIGRYSCLPYYRELEQDLQLNNCRLINSSQQHRWIADFEYYEVLKEYTPKTWFDHNFHKCVFDGPFVVKGKTNSRKNNWRQLMYAPTKRDALEIAALLLQDSLIGEQGIIYRKYEPLVTFEIGVGGLPITNEWRFFFLGNTLLSYGYYWSTADTILTNVDPKCVKFAQSIANIVAEYVNFFVLDVAKNEVDEWILIEVNDGQQSGLSENDPEVLYSALNSKIGNFL
jgi:hypothetical protein